MLRLQVRRVEFDRPLERLDGIGVATRDAVQRVAHVVIQLRRLDKRQGTLAGFDAARVFLQGVEDARQVDGRVDHVGMNRQNGFEQFDRRLVITLPRHRQTQVDVKLGMLLGFGIVDRLDVEDDRLVEHLHLLKMDREAVQQLPILRLEHHGGRQILDPVAQLALPGAAGPPERQQVRVFRQIGDGGIDQGTGFFQIAARQQDGCALLQIRQSRGIGRILQGYLSRHQFSPAFGRRPAFRQASPGRLSAEPIRRRTRYFMRKGSASTAPRHPFRCRCRMPSGSAWPAYRQISDL